MKSNRGRLREKLPGFYRGLFIVIVCGLVAFPPGLLGHGGEKHEEAVVNPDLAFSESVRVGVDEHLGDLLPPELTFIDEKGEQIRLSSLTDRPTLLMPAFFYCVTDCGLQLSFLASAIRELTSHDFDAYRVIALSFDPGDTPETARQSKNNYLPLVGDQFPAENWHFLTGDYENIKSLLDVIGFRIQQTKEHVFSHPNALVVTGPGGKIIRYLYGPRLLSFDIGMALTEAERGQPGISIKKVLSYCIEFNPEQQRYTFQYIRIFGVIIPLVLAAFYIFFLRKGNKT